MKRLLLYSILSVLLINSFGQQPTGLPTPFNNKWYKFPNYVSVDGGFKGPTRDTNWTPSATGYTTYWHSNLWVYDVHWKSVSDGAVNIEWFGANGNGVADSRAAIQAALDASKYVYIPAGKTFVVSSQLNLRDGQILFGAGTTSILKAGADSINVIKATSVTGVVCRDFAINGGGQTGGVLTAGKAATIGIFFDGAKHFEISNITIYNCGTANTVTPTSDNRGGFGILAQSISSECAYGVIRGCTIYDIAGGGMNRGDGIYIGSQNASASIYTHDLVVENCFVTRVGRHCYTVATGTSSIARDIYFNNCFGSYAALCGIDVEPAYRVYISKCKFVSCGNYQKYYNPAVIYGATYGLMAGVSTTNDNIDIYLSETFFDSCYYAITYGNTHGFSVRDCETRHSTTSDLFQFLAGGPVGFSLFNCKFLSQQDIGTFYYTAGATVTGSATNCTFTGGVYASLADGFVFNDCIFAKGFHFSGAEQSGITFNKCIFTDYSGAAISTQNESSRLNDVIVRGCKFLGTGNMTYGILLDFHDAYRWVVEDNEFVGQTTAGIYNSNADSNNVFSSCSRNKFDSCGYGIWINQGLKGGNITSNTFYNIAHHCIRVSLIILDADLTDVNISNNSAVSNCVNGLSIEVSTGAWNYCIVTGNNFRNCSGTKFQVSGGNAGGITANNVY